VKSYSGTFIHYSRATLIAVLFLASVVTPALAQQTDQTAADAKIMDFLRRTEISGFVDGYYSYNFNTPITRKTGPERTFDVQNNSFSLNLAELSFAKVPTADSRGGFRLDLDYGPTQDIVNSAAPVQSEPAIFRNIGQAYLSYQADVGKGLQIDFGKFVTPLGYEVIKTKDNWNYSRSLLFTLAIPFYHMGFRATYNLNDKVGLSGGVVNGWNNAVTLIDKKTVFGQVTVKPTAAFTVAETYIGGPQLPNTDTWRHVADTVATYNIGSKLSLAGNYDYGQDKESGAVVRWTGVAGYGKYQANSWFALTPRWEWYNDEQGFTSGAAQKMKEFTITSEFKHKDGVIARLEYRYDYSDIPFYLNNSIFSDHQSTFTVGMIYAFSTR
jgi:hypothetical protein